MINRSRIKRPTRDVAHRFYSLYTEKSRASVVRRLAEICWDIAETAYSPILTDSNYAAALRSTSREHCSEQVAGCGQETCPRWKSVRPVALHRPVHAILRADARVLFAAIEHARWHPAGRFEGGWPRTAALRQNGRRVSIPRRHSAFERDPFHPQRALLRGYGHSATVRRPGATHDS